MIIGNLSFGTATLFIIANTGTGLVYAKYSLPPEPGSFCWVVFPHNVAFNIALNTPGFDNHYITFPHPYPFSQFSGNPACSDLVVLAAYTQLIRPKHRVDYPQHLAAARHPYPNLFAFHVSHLIA